MTRKQDLSASGSLDLAHNQIPSSSGHCVPLPQEKISDKHLVPFTLELAVGTYFVSRTALMARMSGF